jgi:hypothetical protein
MTIPAITGHSSIVIRSGLLRRLRVLSTSLAGDDATPDWYTLRL